MFRFKTGIVLFLVLMSGFTLAAPAAWFQWRSKLNSVLNCSQTSMGEGWEKVTGPYLDAKCRKLKPVAKSM